MKAASGATGLSVCAIGGLARGDCAQRLGRSEGRGMERRRPRSACSHFRGRDLKAASKLIPQSSDVPVARPPRRSLRANRHRLEVAAHETKSWPLRELSALVDGKPGLVGPGSVCLAPLGPGSGTRGAPENCEALPAARDRADLAQTERTRASDGSLPTETPRRGGLLSSLKPVSRRPAFRFSAAPAGSPAPGSIEARDAVREAAVRLGLDGARGRGARTPIRS